MSDIIKEMEKVQFLTSLFLKIRKDSNIPLRQPLLDFYWYGINLDIEFRNGKGGLITVLAEAINILDQGYDYWDRNFYMLDEVVPVRNNDWHYESGVFDGKRVEVGLCIKIPAWLQKIGDDRKKERMEIMERKAQLPKD